ncbi:Ig-like domain-containing protein [Thiomicrorhabdus indica]|uniref:Ig-like domain-containing protein n=1 Tax=Thiomicrorhabdus indica TaxID=2267253 RepID=UPI00102DD199|nr:hypothetical protein [Thiomicrorhabdus indica]
MINKLKLYIGLLVISMLTLQGCGGPTEEDGVNADGVTGSACVSEEGLSFCISDSVTAQETTSISSGSHLNGTVQLSSLEGFSNKIITVDSSVGTVSQSPIKTDANGIARFSVLPPEGLTSGASVGTITLQSETGESASLNFEFVFSAESVEGGSVEFVGTSKDIISLKGVGGIGYGETAVVTFRVVDTDGNAVEDEEVFFSLESELGGLTLSRNISISDVNGEVSTTVNSGTVPGSVVVKASLSRDGSRSTFSSNLTITTGIPDQNSFSLTAVDLSPDGAWMLDGVTTQLNIRLADQFNNPVPDKTSVYFTAEGGKIDASCQTVNSGCSVTWESQEYRPDDHRVTILAYAVGHETFYDSNSNGLYDEGEIFDDLPNAFRDDDENGRYSQTASGFLSKDEKYFDYDETGSFTGDLDGDVIRDGVFTGLDEDSDGQPNGNGQYDGVTCDHDSCTSSLTYVFNNITLIMPQDNPAVHLYQVTDTTNFESCLNNNGKLDTSICLNVNGQALNLQGTTTFWAMIEDGAVLCEDSNGARFALPTNSRFEYDSCSRVIHSSTATGSTIDVDNGGIGEVLEKPTYPIPNTNTYTQFSFRIKPSDENTEVEEGVLKVSVTTKGGLGFASVDLTDPADAIAP